MLAVKYIYGSILNSFCRSCTYTFVNCAGCGCTIKSIGTVQLRTYLSDAIATVESFISFFREVLQRVRDHFFPAPAGEDAASFVPAHNDRNLRSLEQIFSASIFHAPLERDVAMLRENGAKCIHR